MSSLALRLMAMSGSTTVNASASPTSVSGTGSSSGAVTVTSNSTTVTASGGLPPYTFAWTRLSGSFSITSASAASTTFFESLSPGSDTGTARCTVHSSDGQVAHADVTVTLTNTFVAPNPPTWNVPNGTNLGTFPRGGTTQLIDLYATCTGGVAYSIDAQFSYPVGFGPTASFGSGQGPGSGQVSGAASSNCTPGTYSATVSATNPSDFSVSTIGVEITVT